MPGRWRSRSWRAVPCCRLARPEPRSTARGLMMRAVPSPRWRRRRLRKGARRPESTLKPGDDSSSSSSLPRRLRARKSARESHYLDDLGCNSVVVSPARLCSLGEQAEHPLEFLPGPDRGQLPAAVGGVIHDVTPCPGRLGQPSLPFQQEGAGIDRAEILGVELMRAAPVGERAIWIAHVLLDLTP